MQGKAHGQLKEIKLVYYWQGGGYDGSDPGFNLGEDYFVNGYVYTRVFDYTGSTSSFNLNDVDGIYFANSSLSAQLQDQDPDVGSIPPPTPHDPFVGQTLTLSQQFAAIPEPTSVMLLAFAAGTLFAMRRRFRG